MATLALSALGAYVGGPQGAQIGALLGQQIDSRIFGSDGREGPRLKDLSITTSSYGSPIGIHYGSMRTAGSIIWSTDLVEHKESSGGKGRPKTTSYSYTISLAVALASRPIGDVGRIWADGNLLRGAGGDLKVGGTMRVYRGYGDQPVDPLLAAAKGPKCPAYRGLAYIVFEDLQLEEFGNRIPALNFEVRGRDNTLDLGKLIAPLVPGSSADGVALTGLGGFSYDGGPLAAAIGTVDKLYPVAADTGGKQLTLRPRSLDVRPAMQLPQPVILADRPDAGSKSGVVAHRETATRSVPGILRYYDSQRDYQPGVQHSLGKSEAGRDRVIEFPGAFEPDSARSLIGLATQRQRWSADRLSWSVAELDPDIGPGTIVSLPDRSGAWLVTAWEWRAGGIELELERIRKIAEPVSAGDAGTPALPPDFEPPETRLRFFELPWAGRNAGAHPRIFAAVAGAGPGWTGASLYSGQDPALQPIGPSGRAEAVLGSLSEALEPSQSIRIDRKTELLIGTAHEAMKFQPATLERIAAGDNQILVGNELIQYTIAEQTGPTSWRLGGLLRGRGGTEHAAAVVHPQGTQITLIGPALVPVEASVAGAGLAAMGKGDTDHVFAALENDGIGLRPLCPVHVDSTPLPSGALAIKWFRRARAAWEWLPGVDAPLHEESETYLVGIGNPANPAVQWQVSQPYFEVPAAQVAAHTGKPVWVLQIGTAARSLPTLATRLP